MLAVLGTSVLGGMEELVKAAVHQAAAAAMVPVDILVLAGLVVRLEHQ